MTVFFDIETAALHEAELLDSMPPFDPAEVKCGNLKDPDKVAAKLAEAEAKHKADYLDRAALDALTGRVLAVGVGFSPDRYDAVMTLHGGGDEAALLREFWSLACKTDDRYQTSQMNRLVGFNCCAFDLPFLVKRSWRHGVPVPPGLRDGRWWGKCVVDLREVWQMGDRQARGSLDSVARHLVVGKKSGDGKGFAKLWETDRAAAVAYLECDVRLVKAVAERMGVL